MILLLYFSFRKILRFDRPIFVPEASLRLELMSRQRLVGRRVCSGRGGSYITLFVLSFSCYSIHRILCQHNAWGRNGSVPKSNRMQGKSSWPHMSERYFARLRIGTNMTWSSLTWSCVTIIQEKREKRDYCIYDQSILPTTCYFSRFCLPLSLAFANGIFCVATSQPFDNLPANLLIDVGTLDMRHVSNGNSRE